MIKVDAKGKLCPQPVMMTRDAIQGNPDTVEVTVDNPVSEQNVSRFLQNQGYDVEIVSSGSDIMVKGVKNSVSSGVLLKETLKPSMTDEAGDMGYAVLLARNVIGGDDKELGEVLMKAFLSTLAQMDKSNKPRVIVLMNEGVKLSVGGTSSADTLVDLVRDEVVLLVCGTCVKHFGIVPGVGTISNMFEILENLSKYRTISM